MESEVERRTGLERLSRQEAGTWHPWLGLSSDVCSLTRKLAARRRRRQSVFEWLMWTAQRLIPGGKLWDASQSYGSSLTAKGTKRCVAVAVAVAVAGFACVWRTGRDELEC